MGPGPDLFDDRGPDFSGRLAAWAAETRADDAAAARTREAFLRRAAGEGATFGGILLDLAEQGRQVLVVTTAGRRHVGEVRAVGTDFVVLLVPGRDARGREVLVSRRGIASVQPEGRRASAGDRPVEVLVGLAEALALLAEERERVLVVADGAEAVAGELRSMGRDVLTIALDGDARLAYVALAVVTEVAVA